MFLQGKRVLVLGGTGSLGKVLVRRILTGEAGTPKKIIVFSRDEAKQHYMRLDYLNKKGSTEETIFNNFANLLEFRIGDVRDFSSVASALKDADVAVYAAALKQVPSCEYFPIEAVRTNVMGPDNVVRAIRELSLPVETVVGVSTDKACKPVNVMGMTKALQERVFISANISIPETRFVCVRYGNVLASRGSVVPLFHDQIKNGGPVTITTTDMTRFLLSLEKAVDTIFAAIQHAKRGETYIPIVPAAKMTDIAKILIGDRKIETKVIGIRPGEKIHESLISEEESVRAIKRGEYYAIQAMLPELENKASEPSPLKGEYSSGMDVLSLEETEKLLRHHNLLIGQKVEFEGEMLR